MTLSLPAGLVASLDFDAALTSELAAPRGMLPSRVALGAVVGHEQEFCSRVAAACEAGFVVESQDLVWASKARTRHRPLAAVPLRERVLYQALATALATALPSSWQLEAPGFDEFQRLVLEAPSAKYVVIADIAAFYQYIDHEKLAQHIVEAAGRADLARAIPGLLAAILGRGFGLPQNSQPSDVLAGLILTGIEHELRRSGLEVSRFNDDFRMAAKTRAAGFEALERLQTVLYSAGLTLNEEKSYVLPRGTYEGHLDLREEKYNSALEGAKINASRFARYVDEIEEVDLPDDDEVTADAVVNLLEDVVAEIGAPGQDAFLREANRRLVVGSLLELGQRQDDRGLGFGPTLMESDPAFARVFGHYMRRLARSGQSEAVASSLVSVLGELEYAPPWQLAWLLEPCLEFDTPLPEQVVARLTEFAASSAPPSLTARAILVLAIHGAIDASSISRHVDRMPLVAHPDLTAAAVFGAKGESGGAEAIKAVAGGIALHEWVVGRLAQADDTSWL